MDQFYYQALVGNYEDSMTKFHPHDHHRNNKKKLTEKALVGERTKFIHGPENFNPKQKNSNLQEPQLLTPERKLDHTTYNYKGLRTINLQNVKFTENQRHTNVRAFTVDKQARAPNYILKNNIAPPTCEPYYTTQNMRVFNPKEITSQGTKDQNNKLQHMMQNPSWGSHNADQINFKAYNTFLQ